MTILVDTDVLIWHLRGYPKATQELDALPLLALSTITYLEVLQGLRSKAELHAVQQMLVHRKAQVLPLTPAIGQRATELLESYVLSHGLQMGDALIAATALEHGLTVLTGNVKHFMHLPGVSVLPFVIDRA